MADPYAEPRRRLLADAAAGDWYTLWPRIMARRSELLLLLDGLSEADAARRPAAGEGEDAWSIAEVALHVLRYTRNVREIIEATSRGRTAPKDARGLLAEDTRPFEQVRAQLIRESVALAGLPASLPEPPDMTATVPHAVLGELPSRAWWLFFTVHDGDHIPQLRRLRGEA
jgi:hypothetical protein